MDMSKYLNLYLDESRLRMRQIKQLLTGGSLLEGETVNEIFRHLHTIKGMSVSMGYGDFSALAHDLENQVALVREGSAAFDNQLKCHILQGLEQLQWQFTALEKGKTAAPVLRISNEVLDKLIDNLGELYLANQKLQTSLKNNDLPAVNEFSATISSQLLHLHEQIMSFRLAPLSFLTDRLPDMVRELAEKLGKKVDFKISGDDIEIDRAILEVLDTPITQILRNAVDHGLDPEREGLIEVAISRHDGLLEVRISDNGVGMDSFKLKAAALDKGLITAEEAAELDERTSLYLSCLPGISTVAEVSDISGRGVGLDVVKSQIERVGGRLEIKSAPDSGTVFILSLPLNMALVPSLLVTVDSHIYAIPLWKLLGTTVIEQFFVGPDGFYTNFRGAVVPLYSLPALLLRDTPLMIKAMTPAIVIGDNEQFKILAVDRIEGVQELIINPLPELLAPLSWYSGVSVLGSGQPVLILEPDKIAIS